MIAYRLEPVRELPKNVNNSQEKVLDYLYDIDEDFTSKKIYIERAKAITAFVNKKFKTTYIWGDLFEKPVDTGWRYCKRCDSVYWKDDNCECDY